MEIKEFDYCNKDVYFEIIRKYNKGKELNILNNIAFTIKSRKIFLLLENGIIRKYKVIGYAIIDDDLKMISIVDNINKIYVNEENSIYITDFMIRSVYRSRGIGKYFANYIINDIYKHKNIILQPDGDGYWFWKKFGFADDKISKHTTWILKKY